jgi:hypothetical protein
MKAAGCVMFERYSRLAENWSGNIRSIYRITVRRCHILLVSLFPTVPQGLTIAGQTLEYWSKIELLYHNGRHVQVDETAP